MADADPALSRPSSCAELFVAFTLLALQGFGGVLAISQRVLVEQRRWLGRGEFIELLAMAQVLPGPNVCNLAVMVGDRHFGVRGAMSALAGLIVLPLLLALSLMLLYTQFASQPLVAGALRGMGAVAAGMIGGTAFKLAAPLRDNRLGRTAIVMLALAAFAAIALLRWPLMWVLLGLGSIACALAWRRLEPVPARQDAVSPHDDPAVPR